jgi:hypothetical protein
MHNESARQCLAVMERRGLVRFILDPARSKAERVTANTQYWHAVEGAEYSRGPLDKRTQWDDKKSDDAKAFQLWKAVYDAEQKQLRDAEQARTDAGLAAMRAAREEIAASPLPPTTTRKRQTRRAISVRGELFEVLDQHCERAGIAKSALVEQSAAEAVDQ